VDDRRQVRRDREVERVVELLHQQPRPGGSARLRRDITGEIGLRLLAEKRLDPRHPGPAGEFGVEHVDVVAHTPLHRAGGHPRPVVRDEVVAHEGVEERLVALEEFTVADHPAVKRQRLREDSGGLVHVVEHPVTVVVTHRRDERHQVLRPGDRFLPVAQESLVLKEVDIAPDVAQYLRIEPGPGLVIPGCSVEEGLEHQVSGDAAECAMKVDILPLRRLRAALRARLTEFALGVYPLGVAFHD